MLRLGELKVEMQTVKDDIKELEQHVGVGVGPPVSKDKCLQLTGQSRQ